MPVVVEFNSETYDVLFKDVLKNYPTLLNRLLEDFERYVSSDRLWLPGYFGRDVPYVSPHDAYNAGLMHIHIAIPPATFPISRPQFDRKCSSSPEKDAALVYTQGLYDEDRYSLIALLYPDAHGKARQREIITHLARVAERFREKF